MSKKSVVVLMGGIAGEREVSLSTGEGALAALQEAGYTARGVDATHDVTRLVHDLTNPWRPDVVFNALHGPWGEDGCVQGLLEWLHIPYTHSGVLASALGINKPMSRNIFVTKGIPCPPTEHTTWGKAQQPEAFFPYPYVVKPTDEGSSIGVYIVEGPSTLPPAEAFPLEREVLVEKYIPGKELHIPVLGDTALGTPKAWGAIEIRPQQGFYDYRAKYTAGLAEHIMPAPIPPAAYAQALAIAEQAHKALGCRGASRVDMRYDDTQVAAGEVGQFYVLEINTQPGMTPLSLVPEVMAYHGWSYQQLVSWMVENARLDLPLDKSVIINPDRSVSCAK